MWFRLYNNANLDKASAIFCSTFFIDYYFSGVLYATLLVLQRCRSLILKQLRRFWTPSLNRYAFTQNSFNAVQIFFCCSEYYLLPYIRIVASMQNLVLSEMFKLLHCRRHIFWSRLPSLRNISSSLDAPANSSDF